MPRISLRRPAAMAALALALALGACAGDRDARTPGGGDDVPRAQRYGGTAVIGSYSDLQSMNALTSSDANANMIQRDVLFMTLVLYDDSIRPVPYLAERWDTTRVAGDSLELTFHVRRDVRWHDGAPTDARDVLFTYARARDPRTAFPNLSVFERYWNPRAVLVDDHTIRFRLAPHSDFLDIWYQTPIMPRHLLEAVPPEELAKHPFGATEPVGNGPFRFAGRRGGDRWEFEANPDFPAALGGRPFLDRLVWRHIPEQTTLLTALRTGEVDVYIAPRPQQAREIEAQPSLRLNVSPHRQWVFIAWNTRLPMFADARVRRALGMAIDRQHVVDALLHGYGEVGRASLTPVHWAFDRADPQTLLPYDTAAAGRLLAEVGWVDRDGDGVREDAQGRPFRFSLRSNQGNELRKDIAEMVQAQLKLVGVDAQPQQVEWKTFLEQLEGHDGPDGHRVRDYEAVINGWVDFFRKDDADIFHSRNIDRPYGYAGYANPQTDRYIDSLARIVDRDAARPVWRAHQRLLVQESPYTVLYYPQRLNGVNRRLHDAVMDIRGEFATVREWWIAPADRRGAARADSAPAPGDSAAR